MKKSVLFTFLTLLSLQLAFAQGTQKVLLEEFTGAWCGYCPDGALIMEDILDKHSNVIGLSIHDGDAMVTANGNYVTNFYVSGFPSAVVNRQDAAISRGIWESTCVSALAGEPVVSVSIEDVSYDETTRVITGTVRAEFLDDHTGKHRINMVITEDNVTGTTSGYNQTNYYNSTAGHYYQGAGNPITGYNHRHVVRNFVGGSWGVANVIPNSVLAGEVYTRQFTHNVHPDHDPDEIFLVGMVSLFNGGLQTQRPVLNSETISLKTATSIDQDLNQEVRAMETYPNPFSDRIAVEFDLMNTHDVSLEVINPIGQQVAVIAQGTMTSGSHTFFWNGTDQSGSDAADGIYFVRLQTENGAAMTKMIMLAR